MSPKENVLHMKIDPDLKRRLRNLAKCDNRALSNYIETELRKLVEEKEARHDSV